MQSSSPPSVYPLLPQAVGVGAGCCIFGGQRDNGVGSWLDTGSMLLNKRWFVGFAAGVCLCASACWPVGGVPLPGQSSLRTTTAAQVYVLRGRPAAAVAFAPLTQARHCLIMVPGISSGDLGKQSRFLAQVRLRSGADLAVFQHWGHTDPTRKIASPLATAQAARDLATLCKRVWSGGKKGATIDLLAHSAGTIIVNKAATQLRREQSSVRFRHVLFLGTPHDPHVDLSALKQMSRAVLNIHSAYDKINRNVSGNIGLLHGLSHKPYWNLRLDTSLGGRRMRHYTFLEHTPENWLQYGGFLHSGQWPLPRTIANAAGGDPDTLYRLAVWVRAGQLTPAEQARVLALAQKSLTHSEVEIRYYGALLLGLSGDSSAARAGLKAALGQSDAPAYLRREIYQALGAIANPQDLRYLQRARKTDPASGDVLRDVLRDWKRRRIRPVRRNRDL